MVGTRGVWLDACDLGHRKIHLPSIPIGFIAIRPTGLVIDNPISDRLLDPAQIPLGEVVFLLRSIIVYRSRLGRENCICHTMPIADFAVASSVMARTGKWTLRRPSSTVRCAPNCRPPPPTRRWSLCPGFAQRESGTNPGRPALPRRRPQDRPRASSRAQQGARNRERATARVFRG